jgi:hypothetical protein
MAGQRRKKAVPGKGNAGRDLKKVNKAALKLMEDKAGEIADALYGDLLGGKLLSARLLVELAKGSAEAAEAVTMRPFRSLALELAAEPEWPGEVLEAAAETGIGSREPEGA